MIPKLRFQEFEDSWSQVTIAEAASFRRGSFPQPYNIPQWYDDVNGMPFVQVVDVGNDFRLKPKTKQMISEMAMPKSVFVPKGSIVITIQGSIGRIALTQYDSYVDRTLLIITEKKLPLDDYFFIIALKKIFDYEKTIAVGGTIKTITKEKLAKFKFSLPHRSEQQRIGDFIRLVDQKINLLTKKKEALETYKKGLMQKIFSGELRFKREDGTDYPEWETKKLSDVAQKSTLKNNNFTFIRVLTNSAIRGVIAQEDFFDREIVTEKNLESYYISKKGDFIYNPRISSNAPCGPVNRNELGEGLFSPLYTVFSVQPFYNDYLSYYFHTNLWHRYALAVSNFGARHDRMNISTSDFFNLPFDAPTEKSEMEQIISIAACFNQKIESLNNNLDRLLKLKKGLLQQMFV